MRTEVAVNVAPLTRDEAVLLTNQIGKSLKLAWDLIVRAYHGRAWAALGYESWDAYCQGEFGHARLALPAEERRERVRSLRDHGLSTRAIASATGSSQWTVVDDLGGHTGERNHSPVEDVTGIDGKSYSAWRSKDEIIDAEIVEEDEVGDATRTTPRVALPKQFRKPVTDANRAARRLAELTKDDRFRRNAGLISELYSVQLKEACDALSEALDAIRKHSGAV